MITSAFAMVHSLLADPRFKSWAEKAPGIAFDHWQRLAYNLLALSMMLAFNILATIYFYLGARHEERSLQEEFGQEYEEYQKAVPLFLPRLRC